MIAYHPLDLLIYLPTTGEPLRVWVSNTNQPTPDAGWLRVCWPLEDAQAGRFTIAETKRLRSYCDELWARCETCQQEKQKTTEAPGENVSGTGRRPLYCPDRCGATATPKP